MSTPLPLLHNVLETLSNQQHNNHRIPLMCLLLHKVTVLSWLILSVLIGDSKVVLVDQTRLPMLETWETWVLSLGQEDSMEKGIIRVTEWLTNIDVQLLSHVRLFATPGLQHIRLPCLSLSPKVCSNSCPVSRWCHPTISSSVIPFSSYPQSFPPSGSLPMNRLFESGDQSIGASTSASVLQMNIQGWSPLGLTCLISLASLVLMIKNLPAMQRPGFDSWVRKIFWRREWLPTSIF